MRRNDGKEYELITRAIFQELVNHQSAVNISVEHNVTLRGKTVSHQVDVYWEFSLADFTYRTVIECKDWGAARVKQENVFAFKQKLEDLNNPVGILVSRAGYQQGALDFARTHGILLYQLFEAPEPEPFVVKEGSFATYHLDPRDWTVEYVYFETDYKNITFAVDSGWVRQEESRLGAGLRQDVMSLSLPPQRPAAIKTYDEKGEERGNLLKALMPSADELFSTEGAGRRRFKHSFGSPTFLKVDLPRLPYLKVACVSSDIVITKHPPVYRPMRLEGFVSFVLNNLEDGTTRRIRVQEPNR